MIKSQYCQNHFLVLLSSSSICVCVGSIFAVKYSITTFKTLCYIDSKWLFKTKNFELTSLFFLYLSQKFLTFIKYYHPYPRIHFPICHQNIVISLLMKWSLSSKLYSLYYHKLNTLCKH